MKLLLDTAAGIFFLLLTLSHAVGQSPATIDTLGQLPEVVVQGYLHQQLLLQTPATVGIIGAEQLRSRDGQSLLSAVNTVPGVRMEERSPGSYRLSIRGSLLRSPFGVRNVKVYLDEFPLTDASGNTYLNLIDAKSVERVEVLKGPDGSLFGANSGGVVLINLAGHKQDSSQASVGVSGGSFGLFHEHASVNYSTGKSRFSFNQAYQHSDGYRQNTALQRHFLQAAERLAYGKNNSVKLLVLYSDLHYETPGGLTQAQFDANPQQARPAAGPIPGAVQQQAGVFNTTLFGGLSNELFLLDKLRYVAAVFGTNTDFENPFITNYEKRNEQNLGFRTFAELYGNPTPAINWKWSIGVEGQKGWQAISNFQNNGGKPGLQTAQDELAADQVFYFTRLATNYKERLRTEMALSYNRYGLAYKGWTSAGNSTFTGQWMPRFAANYLLSQSLALRATLSRGYSPPTLAETRSSNNVINTNLQPETGWNKEVGFRLSTWRNRLQMDVSVFRYKLTNAIVRRLDDNGVEYFVNAGGTRQTGVEAFLSTWVVPQKSTGLIQSAQMTGSFTFSHFLFENYKDAANDYSGKQLTGVPQTVLVLGMTVRFPKGFSLLVEWNATSELPLNDANSAYADNYNLVQAKASWAGPRGKKLGFTLFAGANNLFNERYSLGNDINAFGGRYFNAAAPLNFYGGVSFGFY